MCLEIKSFGWAHFVDLSVCLDVNELNKRWLDDLVINPSMRWLMTEVCSLLIVLRRQPKSKGQRPKFRSWRMGRWKRLDALHWFRPMLGLMKYQRRNVGLCEQRRNLLHRTNGRCILRGVLFSFLRSSSPNEINAIAMF